MLMIPASKVEVSSETVVPSTRQLKIDFGTPTTSSKITAQLGVRTVGGEWRGDVALIQDGIYTIADDVVFGEATTAAEAKATNAAMLIFDAVIPQSDAADELGATGLTVREFGALIIAEMLGA